ncbi:phage GP46 family protein [Erwinia aphidicola]|uniref:phage GP46 family protein n=1 Tax=Erwinia aphidicola TaxID=68334 RepID=UPI0030D12A06
MEMYIDPVTQDYTGARARSLENPVYLRLTTSLGYYWADPLLGSLLHTLNREKDKTRVHLLARQYSEQALQPLVDDGRAQSVEVSTDHLRAGWLALLIRVTDAGGDVQTFRHPVRIA